jgi:hypothetical protein
VLPAPLKSELPPTSQLVPQLPKKDNIRTTYHPHSKHGIIVDSFEEYGSGVPPCPYAHHLKPWLPFYFKDEFMFAELVLDSSMSSVQVNCLIKVVQKLIHNGQLFMVRDHRELETLWEGASDTLAPVCLLHCVPIFYQP